MEAPLGESSTSIPPSHDTSTDSLVPIFHGVKFFIQKDLAEQIQTELYDNITELGGRVETKVPRNGYILIQPGSAEAERLQQCWRSKDRPERYFVPYTYIEACKLARSLLKQIFLVDGEPMKIHIHSSIKNINVRSTLMQRISHSGGDPTSSVQEAKVILADPNTEVFQTLCKAYADSPDKYIESWQWVKKTIEEGEVKFTPLVWKNPGGRRAGEERTNFTKEDEDNLCHWIATKIPYKSTGGRTGNRIYQQLCDMSNDPAYAWVTRHTWQSWRERYKKNAARLDPIIAEIVEKNGIQQGEKGQYSFVRQPQPDEAAPASSKKKKVKPKSDTTTTRPASAPVGGMVMVMNADDPVSQLQQSEVSAPPVLVDHVMLSGQLHSLPPPPLPLPQHQHSVEDSEDEWEVREGNDPPPAWSSQAGIPPKRPRTSTSEDAQNPRKRTRTGAFEIAKTYRFTLEEVEEWLFKYDDDLERTRRRFQEMRRLVDSVPDDFE